MDRMITDLRLQYFRSYSDASFELDSGVNIIVGPNASGKTNLLEAVLVIARGGSYRASDTELMQFDASWARIDADTPNGTRTVKLQQKDAERLSKTFEIDGQVLSRLGLARQMPVVLFEPNHLLLLHGSPELRRSFMDDLIEQTNPRFGAVRRHYKRVLTQRNSLLKKPPKNIQEQLFVWNIRLSELGGQMARERIQLLLQFNERITELYGSLSGQTNDVQLEYISQFSSEAYESQLLKKLEGATELDVLRGFTAYGPHRDDMQVLIDGHPASQAASRGETRTLVLALKILEAKLIEVAHTTRPLLLLDDVFSELDGKRRQALTAFISDHQSFITTTDADVVVQHFTSSNIIPTARSV